MGMAQAERTAQETRELILATAEVHLRRFGYACATVSEIARACKMSGSAKEDRTRENES